MSSLSHLLNPRTIAVIGGKEAERVVEQCDKLGFTGIIWPVHPKRETMHGRACFRSVNDLPEAPDAAYVAVNREVTIDVVKNLSVMGARGAVCYAAGFAEADGENEGSGDLQRRLVDAAGAMPIIGPNCYGFINTMEKVALWPDQHGAVACDRGVAILTQSSNVAINLTMQKRGLPIAMMMTAGNQAQQGLSTIGLELLEDERVTALGLHIEGLDDVKAFEALALRARELRKPIVVIKVGKSEQAQTAALTHTASLAGSDIAHDALFERLGVARVHTLDALIETLKLLHVGGPLAGHDLLSLSCSGGEASLMADAADGRGVSFRPFSAVQANELKIELGEIVTVANPLDYNTFVWGDWAATERMFTVALAPKFDLALLVNDFPRSDRCDDTDWQGALDSFILATKATGARAANVASLAETMPEAVAERLMAEGIAPLCGLENAVIAAEAAAGIGAAWKRGTPLPLLAPSNHCHSRISGNPGGETPNSMPVVVDPRCGGHDKLRLNTLDEHQSKEELKSAGVAIPRSMVVSDMAEIEQALVTLQRPVALKGLGVAHKSEMGAVKLNLKTTEDVILAIQKMAAVADRFLIEEMAPKPVAELIVGVTRDPVCGLLLTIGAGGVLAEILDDTVSLLLPCGHDDIRQAIESLKICKVLNGYRGSEAADMDALVANIVAIANYTIAHADTLEELDVNPLFATPYGCVAVDALIVRRTNHD